MLFWNLSLFFSYFHLIEVELENSVCVTRQDIIVIAHKLQRAAPVLKYQHTDNTTALSYVVNNLLHFIDAFDELTNTTAPSANNVCISIHFSIYAVNFLIIFWTIAKILPIYCWGISIWPTLYIVWVFVYWICSHFYFYDFRWWKRIHLLCRNFINSQAQI